jgi:uroporphyrinogen-III synthase
MQPLKGKTVLITRSANQTEEFINQLEDLGAKTISLPLIENKAINQTELRTVFNSKKYTWLIFTSTNAVKFFFESIDVKNVTSKIAVVGGKTKRAIEQLGLQVDFTPLKFTGKQLANELPISVNDSIFIPRSDLAKNDIVETLENRSCKVETLSTYKNTSINYSKTELNTIFNQKVDFITFTSGSAVESFIKLGISVGNINSICIGPETAKVAKANNLIVSAIASPHTIEGMIESIKSLK